jgi:hypothetical protein
MNAQSKHKISKNCPGGKDGLRRHITAASAGILVSRDAEMPHGGITSGDRTTVIQSLTSKIAAASIACPFIKGTSSWFRRSSANNETFEEVSTTCHI